LGKSDRKIAEDEPYATGMQKSGRSKSKQAGRRKTCGGYWGDANRERAMETGVESLKKSGMGAGKGEKVCEERTRNLQKKKECQPIAGKWKRIWRKAREGPNRRGQYLLQKKKESKKP